MKSWLFGMKTGSDFFHSFIFFSLKSTLNPRCTTFLCPQKCFFCVTERPQTWSGDIRLRGGFELRCCLALSYLSVLKRFPIDKQDRNFRCLFSKTSDVLFNVNCWCQVFPILKIMGTPLKQGNITMPQAGFDPPYQSHASYEATTAVICKISCLWI